jgi:Ca2+:H+ antiporter
VLQADEPKFAEWILIVFWNISLLLIPLSLGLKYLWHASPPLIFACAVLAIVPLAEWIRRATEQMAHIAGPSIGGLLNVTFGNAAELILALFVLSAGAANVVKGQITGSIIGNSLLGLGLAIIVGCWGRARQNFKRERAGLLSSLLILAMIALLVPALFDYTERDLRGAANAGSLDEKLSLGVAVVLILVYIANLIYTLVTHRDVFALEGNEGRATWSLPLALGVLAGATALVAVESELVSGALAGAAQSLGVSSFFLGVIVLAVVGNAAEYVAAIYFAQQNQIGLAFSITVGSTIQVALLVAPLLVIVSHFSGHPMNLVFSNPLELIAVAGVAFAVNAIAQDGEVTWFEGVLLLAVYVLLGLAFFYVTPESRMLH